MNLNELRLIILIIIVGLIYRYLETHSRRTKQEALVQSIQDHSNTSNELVREIYHLTPQIAEDLYRGNIRSTFIFTQNGVFYYDNKGRNQSW